MHFVLSQADYAFPYRGTCETLEMIVLPLLGQFNWGQKLLQISLAYKKYQKNTIQIL